MLLPLAALDGLCSEGPPTRHRALSTGPAHAPGMTPELLFGSKLEIPDTPIKSGSTEEKETEVGSQRSSTGVPVALARHVSSPVPQRQREQQPEKEDQFHKNVNDQKFNRATYNYKQFDKHYVINIHHYDYHPFDNDRKHYDH
ncbi:hypothetical protein AAVH_01863 [Aphelenchoides avenae]|nr:hypothetical protein AAVH_01863 [Aphelenchus avenae]